MRRVVHGELRDNDGALRPLMADWSSAVRFAYCRFRDGLDFNAVRNTTKARYTRLNTRQVSDAVTDAQGKFVRTRNQTPIVFGGKKSFRARSNGTMPSSAWKAKRDCLYYARGDETKDGNPNARVVGDTLRVTVGYRTFVSLPLFIASKFHRRLRDHLDSGKSYNVRLKAGDGGKVKVTIDFEVPDPPIVTDPANGVMGVDTNPTCIATACVSPDGNVEATDTDRIDRAYSGSIDKTDYDLGCLVKEIVLSARDQGRPIVAENLQFSKDRSGNNTLWNRVRAGFTWRKFLTMLQTKCLEFGVQFISVHPAYTSVIGRIKYKDMLRVSVHEAAAYVIGRRGLGYNEKLSRYKMSRPELKAVLGSHLEGNAGTRIHSWRMWRLVRGIRPHRAPVSSTGSQRSPVARSDVGENPTGESSSATGRRGRQ